MARYRRNASRTSLSKECPTLVSEWDFKKNAPLTPDDVAPFSKRKVWWKCKKGHSWDAPIATRTRRNRSGCAVCAGRLRTTLDEANPELASEWDFERNAPLTPSVVSPGSDKKVWWKCKKGHSWDTRISYRARGKRRQKKCPYCKGHRIWRPSDTAASVSEWCGRCSTDTHSFTDCDAESGDLTLEEASAAWKFCPYCAVELQPDWRCCPYCGVCRLI